MDKALPVSDDVTLGHAVRIHHPAMVNLYGCTVGDETEIGPFVEIQRGVSVGRRCKISSHAFICSGVTIEDEVFIGHGATFVNDARPRAANPDGTVVRDGAWTMLSTRVCRGASIGSNATILGGVVIGPGALVGAGAVVTRDVAPDTVVAGVPARPR